MTAKIQGEGKAGREIGLVEEERRVQEGVETGRLVEGGFAGREAGR